MKLRTKQLKLVIIESPYAGDIKANVEYARRCLADSLARGEAPLASHLLYPGTLDDNIADQRNLGMMAGLAWGRVADLTAVYGDRGMSAGMEHGLLRAYAEGRAVEFRYLDQ